MDTLQVERKCEVHDMSATIPSQPRSSVDFDRMPTQPGAPESGASAETKVPRDLFKLAIYEPFQDVEPFDHSEVFGFVKTEPAEKLSTVVKAVMLRCVSGEANEKEEIELRKSVDRQIWLYESTYKQVSKTDASEQLFGAAEGCTHPFIKLVDALKNTEYGSNALAAKRLVCFMLMKEKIIKPKESAA